MITFPPEFVATKYPGYYWNVVTKELYTIKGSGILRKMKPHKGKGKGVPPDAQWEGWRVCHQGYRRNLYLNELMKLTVSDSVILVEDK